MTLVPTGYPDFSRRSARSDELLFDGNLGTGAPQLATGVMSVAGSAAIGINAFALTDSHKLRITWYLDELGTIRLTRQHIHLRSATEYRGSIPCLGPFVEIESISDTLVSDCEFKVWTAWQAGPHDLEMSWSGLVVMDASPVLAMDNADSQSVVVWAGLAQLNFRTEIATFRVKLEGMRYDGTVAGLCWFDSTGGLAQNHMVALPAQNILVTFYNDTAVDGVVDLYVNAATYGPIT